MQQGTYLQQEKERLSLVPPHIWSNFQNLLPLSDHKVGGRVYNPLHNVPNLVHVLQKHGQTFAQGMLRTVRHITSW